MLAAFALHPPRHQALSVTVASVGAEQRTKKGPYD